MLSWGWAWIADALSSVLQNLAQLPELPEGVSSIVLEGEDGSSDTIPNAQGQMGSLRTYSYLLSLFGMSPAPSLSSTLYCAMAVLDWARGTVKG
jgi:hypothetical protein